MDDGFLSWVELSRIVFTSSSEPLSITPVLFSFSSSVCLPVSSRDTRAAFANSATSWRQASPSNDQHVDCPLRQILDVHPADVAPSRVLLAIEDDVCSQGPDGARPLAFGDSDCGDVRAARTWK